MTDVDQLVARATVEFAGADDSAQLEQVKARYLGKSGSVTDKTQVDVGATAPVSTNYYAFHYGSILGQANFFLD